MTGETLMALQAASGNRAVGRLLARKPITLDPVFIGHKSKERQKISDEAMKQLPDVARNYATLWLTAAQAALTEAPEPDFDDPTAKRNLYVALAGNLVWAATSLFPQWRAVMIPMSFGGAAVGSGVLAASGAAPPAGKPIVVSGLTKARDRMAAKARAIARDVASECGEKLVSDPDDQRKLLWEKVFPGVPFESSDTLRAQALAQLTAILARVRAQYDAWKQSVEAEASKRAEAYARSASPAGAPPSTLNRPRNWLEDVKKERPFKPAMGKLGVSTPQEQRRTTTTFSPASDFGGR